MRFVLVAMRGFLLGVNSGHAVRISGIAVLEGGVKWDVKSGRNRGEKTPLELAVTAIAAEVAFPLAGLWRRRFSQSRFSAMGLCRR
jgi:hypothetical protein